MKITMEAMIDRIKWIIEHYCYPDKNDECSFEIYKDYRDELSDKTITKCGNANEPMEALDDMFSEWEADYKYEYGLSELAREIRKHMTDEELEFYDENEDEIRDYLEENYYWHYDYSDWNRDIEVNIMVDTGNCNYDFTCDHVIDWYGRNDMYGGNGEFDNNSSIKWLAKTQGKFTKLKKQAKAIYNYVTDGTADQTLLNRPKSEDKFVESCIQELENLTCHMATLTFLVSMPVFDFFKLKSAIKAEEELNKSYYADERKGTGYIILDKSVECGLFCPWQGGGSCLEIELDKDVKLPIKYIFDATVDGEKKYGYDVNDVYGLVSSCWADVVKEIRPMTEVEIQKAKKQIEMKG